MSTQDPSPSDLAFLFKMTPLMRELDSVDRIYRLLLAMATAGRTAGFERAMLFIVNEREGILRGRMGAERPDTAGVEDTFDTRARNVFNIYEGVEGTDLTLKAKSFSVPLEWHRCGLVKAVRSAHPVLAENQLSEFSTDPAFAHFGMRSYLAVPFRLNGRVASVVAVDMGGPKKDDPVGDVSLLYSMTQQATGAAQSLLDMVDNRRRSRIVWKLQQLLAQVDSAEKLDEALRLAAIMMSRAVGGSGCVIKEFIRQRSVHVKTVHEHSLEAGDDDSAIGECMDNILDHAAGTLRPVSGDHRHRLVSAEAARGLGHFYATPLQANANVSGSIVVYHEREADETDDPYTPDNRHFLSMCAGVLAARLECYHLEKRIRRAEEFNAELSANLARERERSRMAEGSFDYHLDVAGDLDKLRAILSKKTPYKQRFPELVKRVEKMQEKAQQHVSNLTAPESHFAMLDVFDMTRRTVQGLLDDFRESGVEITTRIPPGGPLMLMDEEKIKQAVRNIVTATASFMTSGEKMLIECSSTDDRVLLCFADNGNGVPGDTISRLLMPFDGVNETDERKRALSLAGEIIEKHGGDILVKSSMSWRTILILSFPRAANRDRRKTPRDRRRRSERRVGINS